MDRIESAPPKAEYLSYLLPKAAHKAWHEVLDKFDDASIFQTGPFCVAKARAHSCEHMVVTSRATIVAAAQVRTISLPLIGRCIAYVMAGPLFQLHGGPARIEVLREVLRALRLEYVVKRRMALRINPLFTLDEGVDFFLAFRSEDYVYAPEKRARHTIIIDIDRPLADLRKGLEQKWRNCLNRAERNGLQIHEGYGDDLFRVFSEIYWKMLYRKHLAEPGDIRTFQTMQSMLEERHRMKIFIAFDDGEPSAGAICSAVGRRGVYLFGATAERGMKNKASYLLHWRIIQWLKEMGCIEYDLHGVNSQTNPGVYHFKKGLCGTNGRECELVGYFDALPGVASRLLLKGIDFLNRQYKASKGISMYRRYLRQNANG